MSKQRHSLPSFNDDLAVFAADLRSLVFSSQSKAARRFGLSHSTISRYERGVLTPPVGYLAALAYLIVERLRREGQDVAASQQALLRELNDALHWCYPDEEPFRHWPDLTAAARTYVAAHTTNGTSGSVATDGRSAQTEYTYDVFVSYSRSDRRWVRSVLVPRLEAVGLTICLDVRDFRVGVPRRDELHTAVDASRHVLLVLTPRYVEETWHSFERYVRQTLQPTDHDRRLIPLVKERCALPLELGCLTHVDLADTDDAPTAWRRLLESLGAPSLRMRWHSWGEAAAVDALHGREPELRTLEQWIVDDRCRLVGVVGMGGIGKTALATRVARTVQDEFLYVIWRSLRNAPPPDELLDDCLQFLGDTGEETRPNDVDAQIDWLLALLREQPCLLVLDNAEAILAPDDTAGRYRDGYEAYGRLFRRIGESRHRSCLLLTARETPWTLTRLDGTRDAVRTSAVRGLTPAAGRALLEAKGLRGTEAAWRRLVGRYSGNPLALQLVADTIRDVYAGDVAAFLDADGTLSGEVRDLLDEQFRRACEVERDVLYWLAVDREPVSAARLQELLDRRSTVEVTVVQALRSLRRRSLVEQGDTGFTLQNVVLEYVTERLIRQVSGEIIGGEIHRFGTHPLVQAQAAEYVRQSQLRLLLAPLADRLRTAFPTPAAIAERLTDLLTSLRDTPAARRLKYAAGNTLNLLLHLGVDIAGYDFSALPVREGYFQGVTLHDANFACADLSTSVFTEAFGRVYAVDVSPNGHLVAAGTDSGAVRVWRTSGGEQVLHVNEHDGWVWTVAFSPDGTFLASGSGDKTLKLWNLRDGTCHATLREDSGAVWSVAFSPDGAILATAGADRIVRLWDIAEEQCRQRLSGHAGWIRSIDFGPDGVLLASAGDDGTARLWDVRSGDCLRVLPAHDGRVWSVAFDADARTLVTAGSDATVNTWDVRTGDRLTTLQGHSGWVLSAAFSPDGTSLVSGGKDGTVRTWDPSTGTCLKTLRGHTGAVWSVAWSADDNVIVSGGYDQSVRLWDAARERLTTTFRGYDNSIWDVAWAPSGELLAVGSNDTMVRLWKARAGTHVRTLRGHTAPVWSVAWNPDGTLLASGSYDQTVRLWDPRSGRCLHVLEGHKTPVWSVAFSPDGTLLASGSGDHTTRLWDAATGRHLDTLRGHTNLVWSLAFHPNEDRLVSGGCDGTIRVWDLVTGTALTTMHGHSGCIRSLAVTSCGTVLWSAGDDQTVRRWDLTIGEQLDVLHGHTAPVWAVDVTSTDEVLVTGCSDHCVRLWDPQTKEVVETLHGHTGSVRSLVCSPVGRTVASVGMDETIRLWDVRTGECLRTMRARRPYEGMNITGAKGLTDAQKASLRALGAVEDETTMPGKCASEDAPWAKVSEMKT